MHPLRTLRHCVREAGDGLWRNPGLSLLATLSIGVSLYVLGLFLLLAYNLNLFVGALGRDMQVQIYLSEEADASQIAALRAELASDPAVQAVVFVTREQARERFRRTFPSLRDLSERLGTNPFPASFELILREGYRDPEAIERLAVSYRKAGGVEEVRYDLGWIRRLGGLVALVRGGGLGLGGLLALAVMVTVGATVRLTVLARREEIEIMKLVGATGVYIRGPFLLAAAAQGFVGGGLSMLVLRLTHRLLRGSAIYRANPFLEIVAGRFLPWPIWLPFVLGGGVLGLLAATLALRRAASFRIGAGPAAGV
ncbi:MAG TPA: permease-like cell division protein FtsX [Candidatus Polarisedimenticolia bacterium]|nr:permease-like cell division protein FtsX [Candidatus Polarisedimenticolia bacterium]